MVGLVKEKKIAAIDVEGEDAVVVLSVKASSNPGYYYRQTRRLGPVCACAVQMDRQTDASSDVAPTLTAKISG